MLYQSTYLVPQEMKGRLPSGNGAWVGKLAIAVCRKRYHRCFSKSKEAWEKMAVKLSVRGHVKKIIKDALLRKRKAHAPGR